MSYYRAEYKEELIFDVHRKGHGDEDPLEIFDFRVNTLDMCRAARYLLLVG